MFYVNNNTELNAELLQKMLNKHFVEVKPRLQRYKNYYDGIQNILNKTYADPNKPCSRTVINYCRSICDAYTGYLATPSFISYSSQQDIEEIMNILRYNDYQTEDADLLLDALVYGVAAELMYIDADGHTRFRLIDPRQCFAVYDDSLTGDLLYFVRYYAADEWSNSNTYYVDVYTPDTVRHYTMSGENGYLTYTAEERHYFSQCPANVLLMPDEKSIFDCIMTLQDAANELLSSEIDDYTAFVDSYMVLQGVDAEQDDIAAMKEDRIMLLPQDASAQYLTKNANDTQVENIMKRIHDSIYRIAACPDFSSETFVGGVSSGVAIRYRLTGMEQRAGKIEAAMRKALQRRIEIIAGIASLKLGEEVFRDISIDFKRNIPDDLTATIATINTLKGMVSDATLLGLLPFVDDVNAEIEAVAAQKEQNMAMYSFAAHSDDEDETV